MNAMTKFSIALAFAAAAATAVFLYGQSDDEGFDAGRTQPQDAICKQDSERLARLRARPSLDEGLKFVTEIRCLQLWPQLQTLLDGLSNPSRPNVSPTPSRIAPDVAPASEPARTLESSGLAAPSTALDDACKHDEDRLAQLRANPSVVAAMRFDSQLKCPRLQPQLPAILDQLSQAPGSVEEANRGTPRLTTATGAPPLQGPEATSSVAKARVSDDPCPQEEERLAELQAKASLFEAVRFDGQLKCFRLQPQLLALLESLGKAQPSAAAALNDAPPDTASVGKAAPPASKGLAPALEAKAVTSEETCKQDEQRLARLLETPSSEEAARFGQELRCEAMRPRLIALTEDLAKPSPRNLHGALQDADAERRIVQLEHEEEALAAKVRRLEQEREAPSGPQANTPPTPGAPPEQYGSGSESVAALASLPVGMPARVLIRHLTNSADARAQAEKLANALARQGIEVVDLRESRGAVRTELNFSYAPDAAIAQQIGDLIGVAPVRRPQPKDGLMVRPGTVELSLSGDSRLEVVKTTSTRESKHE